MSLFETIEKQIFSCITKLFSLPSSERLELSLNVDKDESFGDLSCNAAMILAKELKQSPMELAKQIQEALISDAFLLENVTKIDIAGPGFINIRLKPLFWEMVAQELVSQKDFFKLPQTVKRKKIIIEFVSANPTGPLHIGHGRGGIIGDVLGNILNFVGHEAYKEYYINDTGNQILKLGNSLKIRCKQELGEDAQLPEDGYQGEYLVNIAKECIKEHGKDVTQKPDDFFADYAKAKLLSIIKKDLKEYGVRFDNWFSEKSLHEDGSVQEALEILKKNKLAYEKDDALWFKSTEFGDDKDRVIRKQDGTLTYIAADIAYHKNKFDRKFDVAIDILGQDHHGYVKRLKATMDALGYSSENLDVVLYQLVSIKLGDEAVKMSKRAGTFTTLREVIDIVGTDVSRFFYLNRKAEAHLDFDLEAALKKTEENPAYYIQYAYVRTNSVLKKATEAGVEPNKLKGIGSAEISVLKKIVSLRNILFTIASTYQTHLLAYYTIELAKTFHSYYTHNRIINLEDPETTKTRLALVVSVKNTLGTCLELLGLSKPEKM